MSKLTTDEIGVEYMITEKQAKQFAGFFSHSVDSVENLGGSHNHVHTTIKTKESTKVISIKAYPITIGYRYAKWDWDDNY